jgi:ribosomal protein S27AE
VTTRLGGRQSSALVGSDVEYVEGRDRERAGGVERLAERWRQETEAVLTGFREWRQQHPCATLAEIEAALDERWAVVRARVVQDAALASANADLTGTRTSRPACPECGTPMAAHGRETRRLTTLHDQPITLIRQRTVCPACGAGLFPPG